ncbi:MAG: hypothetical protein SNJ77_05275 [Cytophagales bacterium]
MLLELLTHVKGTPMQTIFPHWLDFFIAQIAYPYLQNVVKILALLFMIGLFTRWVAPILSVTFLFLFSFWYSKFDAPVPWLYVWFPLIVLSFSKCADAISLDALLFKNKTNTKLSSYRWPVELVAGWFAYIYFAAGLAKIVPINKGLNWMDGGTSHRIMYDRYLDSISHYLIGFPLIDFSAPGFIYGFLSIISLLIELLCVVIFFTVRLNNLIIFLVMSMHIFLYFVGVPGFVQIAFNLCICLIKPEIFNELYEWRKNIFKTFARN